VRILRKLILVHALAACWTFGSSCLAAEGVCSLSVRVLAPDGRRPEASVSVREASGRVTDKEQEDGDVQFCDLGIAPVTVKVGGDGLCNQVTIHNVPISWDHPYRLTVTYDPEACDEHHRAPPPVPICEVLFRV
jgi:hypothetical protein